MHHLDLRAATAEDLEEALQVLFQRLPAERRAGAVANARALFQSGEIDRNGLWTARQGGRLVGVMLTVTMPGALGIAWPPHVRMDAAWDAVEDALTRRALQWLRGHGAKFVQALLHPEEEALGLPLVRNGFRRVTTLWFLRRTLEPHTGDLPDVRTLTFLPYSPATHETLKATLLRTYAGSQDCPELDGLRDMEEVLAGHQAQGKFNPATWWIALADGQPVGVILVNAMPEWHSWDVVYMGVVPDARGRGHGRQLMLKAFREAREAGVTQLTLTVDDRNVLGRRLYRSLGFEAWDQRLVYLAFVEQVLPESGATPLVG